MQSRSSHKQTGKHAVDFKSEKKKNTYWRNMENSLTITFVQKQIRYSNIKNINQMCPKQNVIQHISNIKHINQRKIKTDAEFIIDFIFVHIKKKSRYRIKFIEMFFNLRPNQKFVDQSLRFSFTTIYATRSGTHYRLNESNDYKYSINQHKQ